MGSTFQSFHFRRKNSGNELLCPARPMFYLDTRINYCSYLVYLKTFPLQELQAAAFSISQPQANFWIHLFSPIVRKTLKRLKQLPERNSQKLEFILKDCHDVLPGWCRKKHSTASGLWAAKRMLQWKKKVHSVKNNILSLPERRIIFLSQTYAGSVHDKKICDEQPLHLPGGITLWQDTGFIGHCPDGVNIQMPMKSPKAKIWQMSRNRKTVKYPGLGYLSSMQSVEPSVVGLSKTVCVATSLGSGIWSWNSLVSYTILELHWKNNAL